MWQVYDCLVYQHDYRLVLIAALICLLGSIATFTIADRALTAESRAVIWMALAGICGGAAVWSTHFVAMLAYQQTLPISYQLGPTLGSLVSAILIIGCGFAIALPRIGRAGAVIAGGLIVGAGVATMHYLGMTALSLPGRLSFDSGLATLAVAFSLTFGAVAFYLMFHRSGTRDRAAGVACFVLMIVLLHFTGMGAVQIELGHWENDLSSGISREALAGLVALIATLLLSISLAGALFDRRRSSDLRAQAKRFKIFSDSALEGLVIHRDGELIDSNAAARRVLSLTDDVAARSIFPWFGPADRSQIEQWLLQPNEDPVEIEMTALDGRRFPAEVSGRSLRLADGSFGQVLAIRDISARKMAEAQLHHQALHDPLTDLPNRRMFHELAEKVRSHADRHGGQFAVLALDLDGFKMVNDLHGHEGRYA